MWSSSCLPSVSQAYGVLVAKHHTVVFKHRLANRLEFFFLETSHIYLLCVLEQLFYICLTLEQLP